MECQKRKDVWLGRLTFECKRKPNEAEAEQLLTELKELPSNALDIGDYSDLKNRIIEEGIKAAELFLRIMGYCWM